MKRLRAEMTPSEKKLWTYLRELNKAGANFRRQAAVDQYVFDFGDYSARVLIELDGSIHRLDNVRERDNEKSMHAIANRFKLVRFANNDVWDRPAWVIAQVRDAMQLADDAPTSEASAPAESPPPPTPPREGAGSA